MTEPPRPPGEGPPDTPPEPIGPLSSPPGPDPTSGYAPPYPPPPGDDGAPGYGPPPGSGPPPGYAPPPPGYAPPPGYGPPPPGYGPPPPGYGSAPGYPMPGYATADDRTWSLLAHFSGPVGAFISAGPLGFVGPLIVFLAKGSQSPTVRAQSLAALNFQLLWSIIGFVVLFVSWCMLFIPTIVIFVIQIVVGIIAGIKAANGEPYNYPMTANLIK